MRRRAWMAGLSMVVAMGAGGADGARGEVVRRQPVPSVKTRTAVTPARRVGPAVAPAKAAGVDRVAAFRRAAAKARPSAAQLVEAEGRFRALPVSVQDRLLAVVDPQHATLVRIDRPSIAGMFKVPELVLAAPSISSVFPAEGTRGEAMVVGGTLLNDACAVYFRGVKLPTVRILNFLCFTVPPATPLGVSQMYVKDEARNQSSATVNVPVAAPRGFRGNHGFNFANFGTGLITWPVFRNYFGANEVEFANGTRRPAAETWYNASYRGVGGGGNCYGMSMRSVRSRFRDWRGTQSAWWSANEKPRVWDYPKAAQVVESINWDQGGQLSAQSATVINARRNGQNHHQAFTFIKNALATGQLGKTPILGMWGAGGHAVVAYATEETATEKKIPVWDNNRPYSTTEANDGNSLARVFTNTGAFQYGGFNTMIAFTYEEMNPADPNLPASATGAMNAAEAGLSVVVVDDPAALVEVADAQGRWLFRNGVENRDPKTRIPNATHFVSFTGAPARPGDPAIFLFGSAKGATYDVKLRPDRATAVRSFSRGFVSEVVGARGTVRFARMLEPEQAVELPQPALSRPTSLKLIAVEGDGAERVFDVLPQGVMPDRPVSLKLDPARKGIIVHNTSAIPLDVKLGLQGFSKAGALSKKLMPVSRVPAGGFGTLSAPDFGKLETLAPGAFRVLQGR